MTIVWYQLCQTDRDAFGQTGEWGTIDIEQILDTTAGRLEAWERAAGGFPIEMAIAEFNRGVLSARAARMLVWIGRKQNGDNTLKTVDSRPETWDQFNPRTLRIRMRIDDPANDAQDAEPEAEEPAPLDDKEPLPEAV